MKIRDIEKYYQSGTVYENIEMPLLYKKVKSVEPKGLNDEGVSIVQVTHSEKNAAYGNRLSA